MRVVSISDTHTLHERIEYPEGDILLHSGDILNSGYFNELNDLLPWAKEMAEKYPAVIFTPGNHDWCFYEGYPFGIPHPEVARQMLEDCGWVVLIDQEYTHNGVKIYGAPWQPEFHNWAFNLPRNGKELVAKWKMIPDDTDILMTHGPPKNIGDKTRSNYYAGCEALERRLYELKYAEDSKLKIHQFGHIHEGYGTYRDKYKEDLVYINASICTLRPLTTLNNPIITDI